MIDLDLPRQVYRYTYSSDTAAEQISEVISLALIGLVDSNTKS